MNSNGAHVELSFAPNFSLISTVRRFVSDFYAEVVDDDEFTSRLAMATHELLENAVRYSADGQSNLRVGLTRDDADLLATIETTNRADAANLGHVRRVLDGVIRAPDPEAHYQRLMRETAARPDGSGLGLGRVRAEADMELNYSITGDTVRIQATARVRAGEDR